LSAWPDEDEISRVDLLASSKSRLCVRQADPRPPQGIHLPIPPPGRPLKTTGSAWPQESKALLQQDAQWEVNAPERRGSISYRKTQFERVVQ
jgi:hypothetical protein